MISRQGLYTAAATALLLAVTLIDRWAAAALALTMIAVGVVAFPEMRRRGIFAAAVAAVVAVAVVALLSRLG